MNVAIWVGGRKGHPFTKAGLLLREIISSINDARITTFDSKDLLEPGTLKEFDVIVSYTQGGWVLSPEEEESLFSFVSGGCGFIGVHGATASFKQNPNYHEFIGGRFTGHGLPRKYVAKVLIKEHPIMAGVHDFIIKDEPYNHELQRDKITILMARESKNESEPVVYSKFFNRGKIVYMAFGHFTRSFKNQDVRRLIINSVNWVIHT
ncbi:MAG: ThuA domain-containing protein [Promethearchaeota archaeon]